MAVTTWASDHEGASSSICLASRASSTRIAKSRAAWVPAFMASVIETARRRAITALDTAIRQQLHRLPGGKEGRADFPIDDAPLSDLQILPELAGGIESPVIFSSLPNWAGALSRSRTSTGLRPEFTSNGMSDSLRASAIRPPSCRSRPAYNTSAAGRRKKIARQPGHGEYGNTSCATRHIARKAALSKQNAAHFPMIKF